jgi:pyridoxamine 5'-phosphate oxidase
MVQNKSFSEEMADKDPFVQFDRWYKEHLLSSMSVPDSFSLATSTADGRVSVRTVLLKEYGPGGFVFFTNYESKKGIQIEANPVVAMLFYWPESARQIRIEGSAAKISEEESVKYFSSRPRESQVGAWASRQGRIIPGREFLENQQIISLIRFIIKRGHRRREASSERPSLPILRCSLSGW